jgi:aryl-alcohol dehydrogenase-like predicted oxidoreductase
VNYYDVAPMYGQGEAEEKMGIALKPYRDRCFLACKTNKRDKETSRKELELSLKRLRTDHFDLYQLHSITSVEKDVDAAFAEGGVMETVLKAREEGKIRHIGFSSHSVEAALKAIESGVFDTILHPVNFICHYSGNFDQAPLEAAREKKMGLLGLKAMARTRWPAGLAKSERPYPNPWYEPYDDPALAALSLRWAMGRGLTATIPPGDPGLYTMALNVASVDRPLESREEDALKQIALETQPLFSALAGDRR